MADQPLPLNGGTLDLYRGDTRVWTDVIEENMEPDPGLDPVWEPLDLTGWTVLSQIRRDLNREGTPIDVTVTVMDAANGVVERLLTADASSDLGPDKSTAYMDVQLKRTSDGFVRTYKKWKIRVAGDVSDA